MKTLTAAMRNVLIVTLTCGMWQMAIAQDPHIHPLEPDTKPIHVRALFQQNPASEVTISWTTTADVNDSKVYYDTQPRNGNVDAYRYTSEYVITGAYTLLGEEEGMDSWYHHAMLSDLEPSTTYYLVAESDGDLSREYHFVTAASDDREVAVLVSGDSRVGNQRTLPDNPRRQMFGMIAGLVEDNPKILGLAHTADYTNRAYWSQLYYWLKDYTEMTTTRDGRLLPIIPSRGNHDLDVGFDEMFNWPGGRAIDSYYVSNLSEKVSLIALNTEISLSGDQRIWLENQLRELRPSKRYIMPFYHKPAYPSVRSYQSGVGRRQSWVPLFEEYNIEIVAEGHDHSVKRTVPIRANEMQADGIVYIGDGGLGVAPREVVPQRWYLQGPGMAGSIHNVHLLEFNLDAIHGWGYDINGEVIDEFIIPGNPQDRVEYFHSLINN